MSDTTLTWLTDLIWSIADDVLCDAYMRGKHRNIILPETVIRRLDTVLEPEDAEQSLRSMAEARADIAALARETEEWLAQILVETE